MHSPDGPLSVHPAASHREVAASSVSAKCSHVSTDVDRNRRRITRSGERGKLRCDPRGGDRIRWTNAATTSMGDARWVSAKDGAALASALRWVQLGDGAFIP